MKTEINIKVYCINLIIFNKEQIDVGLHPLKLLIQCLLQLVRPLSLLPLHLLVISLLLLFHLQARDQPS